MPHAFKPGRPFPAKVEHGTKFAISFEFGIERVGSLSHVAPYSHSDSHIHVARKQKRIRKSVLAAIAPFFLPASATRRASLM